MKPLSKFELKRQIKRFHADKNRGISINLFCELAGMSMAHFLDVFIRDKEPLTEVVQRELKVLEVKRVMQVLKEQQVHKGHQDLVVLQGHKGHKVLKVL